METTYRFIIQKGNQYYWKGNGSSVHGWRDSLGDAYLFRSVVSAKTRIRTLNQTDCKVVTVKLEVVEL